MTTSGLASLQAVHEARADESAPPLLAHIFQPREGKSFLRVYGRALTLSGIVHLLLLLISPLLVVIDVPEGGGSGSPAPAGGGGEQVSYIDIGPSSSSSSAVLPLSEVGSSGPAIPAGAIPTGATATSPTLPVEDGAVQAGGGAEASIGPFPTAGAGGGVVGGSGAGGGDATGATGGADGTGTGLGGAAGILRPGYRDPRLYVDPPLIPDLEKTPQQLYAEHLSSRIAAVRDSMAADDARARTSSDWVRTDGSGNRWGLSSEGLHLGGITIPRSLIPSPRSTGDNMSQEDARERQRQRDEIQRQEADRARRTIQDERARSMREADAAQRSNDGN